MCVHLCVCAKCMCREKCISVFRSNFPFSEQSIGGAEMTSHSQMYVIVKQETNLGETSVTTLKRRARSTARNHQLCQK